MFSQIIICPPCGCDVNFALKTLYHKNNSVKILPYAHWKEQSLKKKRGSSMRNHLCPNQIKPNFLYVLYMGCKVPLMDFLFSNYWVQWAGSPLEGYCFSVKTTITITNVGHFSFTINILEVKMKCQQGLNREQAQLWNFSAASKLLPIQNMVPFLLSKFCLNIHFALFFSPIPKNYSIPSKI